MAKEKTQADVELARIKADLEKAKLVSQEGLERTRIRWGVVRWISALFFLTIMVGIIAWAVVRMADRPSWLTLVLAGIGLLSGSSMVAIRLAIVVRTKSLAITVATAPGEDEERSES